MLNLTHKTTDKEIASCTKNELVAVYKCLKGFDLPDMVHYVQKLRDNLIQLKEDEERKVEADRQDQLVADRKDETHQAVLVALTTAIGKDLATNNEVISEAQGKLANTNDLVYTMKANFEKVALAQYKINELTALAKFVARSEQDYTKQEFLDLLEEDTNDVVRRVLSDSGYHSTCPLSNVAEEAKFRGLQWKAKYGRQLVKCVKEAYKTGTVNDLHFSFYVY